MAEHKPPSYSDKDWYRNIHNRRIRESVDRAYFEVSSSDWYRRGRMDGEQERIVLLTLAQHALLKQGLRRSDHWGDFVLLEKTPAMPGVLP